jgi:hypothetical protein
MLHDTIITSLVFQPLYWISIIPNMDSIPTCQAKKIIVKFKLIIWVEIVLLITNEI